MTEHEKRIREALEADEYLTANVAKNDLRALLADLDRLRDNLDAMRGALEAMLAERSSVAQLSDACQAALEVISEAKAEGWQPIETAPKDGQCLLWVDTDDGGEVMKLPRDSDGNWLYESEPMFTYSFYLKPTHWQPLPAPPAQKESKNTEN